METAKIVPRKIRIKEFQKAAEKVIDSDEFVKLYGIEELTKLMTQGQVSGPTVEDRVFSAEVIRKWLCSLEFTIDAPNLEVARERAAEQLKKMDSKLRVMEDNYHD